MGISLHGWQRVGVGEGGAGQRRKEGKGHGVKFVGRLLQLLRQVCSHWTVFRCLFCASPALCSPQPTSVWLSRCICCRSVQIPHWNSSYFLLVSFCVSEWRCVCVRVCVREHASMSASLWVFLCNDGRRWCLACICVCVCLG